MGVRRIFIVADPTRSFFRLVDQVLPTAKCRMISATEASQMSYLGLGHLDAFSMVEVYRVGGGVERRGGERSRDGASNDVSGAGVDVLHPKRLRLIISSFCAFARRRLSSSRDAPRPHFLRSAYKAGQRSHKWSYEPSL